MVAGKSTALHGLLGVTRTGTVALDVAAKCRTGTKWRGPGTERPRHAGEGLELEAFAFPLTTGLAGAVEGAKAGVDGTSIRFGTELVVDNSSRHGKWTFLAVGTIVYAISTVVCQ